MAIPKRSFVFIRHGQAAHNLERRMVGPHTPSMLTEAGKIQAATAGQKLTGQGITRVFTSPIPRALETAEIINQALNLPLVAADFLTEQSYGIWENRVYEEVCREHNLDPETFDYLHNIPADGESFANLQQRIATGLEQALTAHPDDLLLFVSHGGVFNALHNLLLGHIDETPNATPYLFQPTGSGWERNVIT